MDVSGEDELDLADPLLHRLRLRLAPLVVLLEVVGEVAVEVEASGVVPSLASLTSFVLFFAIYFFSLPDKCPRWQLRNRPDSCLASRGSGCCPTTTLGT